MIGAAQHDPVAAILLHSSPADIETVIIDGIMRKRDGKMLPITIDESARQAVGKDKLDWVSIAREIVVSRERVQEELENIDSKEAMGTLLKMFHIDEIIFVD